MLYTKFTRGILPILAALQRDGFDKHPQEDYNLLRHNGAIYSLALSYDRHPNPEVLEVMVRALDYLKNLAIAPLLDLEANDGSTMPDLLAPWEGKRAKLGGAGLGLIALCNVERILPGTTSLDTMREMGNFIRFLQREDGSFASRYHQKTGKDDDWTSLYYPGGAALGLVYLAELESDPTYKKKWLDTATDALLYLERLRRNMDSSEIEPDHWALLATARLLPHLSETSKEDPVAYWLVYRHAVRVVESMLIGHTEGALKDSHGCFTFDRRTCPTATRLEGMIASLSFVRDDEILIDEKDHKVVPLKDRMLHDIALGIELLVDSQPVGPENGMQGAVSVKYQPKKFAEREVRVDYVQHSMSAAIAYEAYLNGESKVIGASKHMLHGISPKRKLPTIQEPEYYYEEDAASPRVVGSSYSWQFLMALIILCGILRWVWPNEQNKTLRYSQ